MCRFRRRNMPIEKTGQSFRMLRQETPVQGPESVDWRVPAGPCVWEDYRFVCTSVVRMGMIKVCDVWFQF